MGNVGNGVGQKDPSARQTMYIGRVGSLGLCLSNVCKLSDLSGPLRHFHFHILFYRGSLADGCTKMALPICGDIDSCASKNFIGLLQELLFHNKMGFGRIWVVAIHIPKSPKRSQKSRSLLQDPVPVASSAYHNCFTSGTSCFSWQIRGFTESAYIAIAKGSPWVVPSDDSI